VSTSGGLGLSARGPFRLEAVAISHGWFQTAPFSWDPSAQVLLRVEPIGTLRIESAGSGVRVHAPAPLAPEERSAVAARVTRMLQLDADLTGFPEAVRVVDRRLARDLVGYGGGRILAGGSLFEDVVKGICGTNTTWTQAVTAINRIASLGPGGAFPGPADVLRAGEDWLRAEARVGYRAPAVVAASRSAIDGTLAEIDEDSRAGDTDRTEAGLRRLAGIGPATSGFLLLLMGHYDRPSIDSATLRVASREWFAGRRPTPREVLRRVAPAGRYSGLVLAWSTLRAWQREIGLIR
jgi:3-methyladenine DNA glycosylase/8-oxoguanine DNA glycosylase